MSTQEVSRNFFMQKSPRRNVPGVGIKFGPIFMPHMSLVVRKPVFGVSDQVQHKPGCTTTEDSESLEISDLGSRGIVLSE